jgi:hypothetical protein
MSITHAVGPDKPRRNLTERNEEKELRVSLFFSLKKLINDHQTPVFLSNFFCTNLVFLSWSVEDSNNFCPKDEPQISQSLYAYSNQNISNDCICRIHYYDDYCY